MNYEERKEAKIEYARKKAAELNSSAEKFFSKGFCETTGIPMGQPILVGHHSEKRHRATIRRYENRMHTECDNLDRAKELNARAERLENNTIISSDDPKATDRLNEKLQNLEGQRQKMKDINKAYRKHVKGDSEDLKKHYSEEKIQKIDEKVKSGYSWEKSPFVSWQISNLGQNIRSVKQRIKCLEKESKREEFKEEKNGMTLKLDKEENRVKLFFPGKPDAEIRTKLKGHGFRWSPRNGCWQAFVNDWAIVIAKEIMEEGV